MTDSLVRSKLDGTLRTKSLQDLMRVHVPDKPPFLLLDVSGSMGSMSGPCRNGKYRIDSLRDIVKDIQKQKQNELPMVAFGGLMSQARMVTDVPSAGGGTPLTEAILLAKDQGASRAICISDGMPQDPQGSLEAARSFGGRIDVVFVGNPGDAGEGFMQQLASETGGTQFTGDLGLPKELTGRIMGLLGDGEEEDDDE